MKQVSGHKTDYTFQHYILVTEDEMSGMKWLEQKEEKNRNDGHLYGHL